MNRRTILTGLVGLVAAPAVLRLGAHMPVRAFDLSRTWYAAVHPVGLRDGSSPRDAGWLYAMFDKARAGDRIVALDGDYRVPGSPVFRRTYNVIGGHNA